jgi:hypothetical protein
MQYAAKWRSGSKPERGETLRPIGPSMASDRDSLLITASNPWRRRESYTEEFAFSPDRPALPDDAVQVSSPGKRTALPPRRLRDPFRLGGSCRRRARVPPLGCVGPRNRTSTHASSSAAPIRGASSSRAPRPSSTASTCRTGRAAVGRGASLARFPQHSVGLEGSSGRTSDRHIGGFAGRIESRRRPKCNRGGAFPGALCNQTRKQKNAGCRPFMELAGLEPATSWVRSRRSPS